MALYTIQLLAAVCQRRLIMKKEKFKKCIKFEILRNLKKITFFSQTFLLLPREKRKTQNNAM